MEYQEQIDINQIANYETILQQTIDQETNQQQLEYIAEIENIELQTVDMDIYQEQLRPHQLKAIEFMKNNDKGVMEIFCGTGKSKIMYEYTLQTIEFNNLEDSRDQCNHRTNILIVIPSLTLVTQFLNKYINTINSKQERKTRNIDLNVTVIDSDHKTIFDSSYLSNHTNLILITYASLQKTAQFLHLFDLVIFDEAHHIVTKRVLPLIQLITKAKCFYFTATPRICKKLLNMYEQQPQNAINCGDVFKYDFRTAINDGWVVDYQLNFCIYNENNTIESGQDNIKAQFNAMREFALIHKRTRIIAFNQYIHKITINKTNSMSFASLQTDGVQIKTIDSSVKNHKNNTCNHIDCNQQDSCNKPCDIKCNHTDCKHKLCITECRDIILEWFQMDDYHTTKFLFNAACIKEGIDLPCTDLIVFCDDKQSPIQIIQCIGRVTRLSANKQTALITAMINYQDQCEFKIITNICKALKSSDINMKQIIETGTLASIVKFTNILPNHMITKVKFTQFTNQIIVALGLNINRMYTRLDQILEYCQKNNKLPTDQSKDKEIISLSAWLTSRKSDLKKGKLDKDLKIAIETKLKDYGFKWDFDKLQEYYDRLEEIYEWCQKNNQLPSHHNKDKEICSFGSWLCSRKQDYKGNLKRNIQRTLDNDHKIAIETKLKDFGFKWEVDQLQAHYDRLEEIIEYCKTNNKLPSKHSKDIEITSMGLWLTARKGDQKKGILDKDLKNAIESELKDFGFYWDKLSEFNGILEKILEYGQRNNKLPSVHSKDKKIASMGNWLGTKKQDYKKGDIDKDLKVSIETKLKEFGFKWDFDKLQEYYDRLEEIVEWCQKNNKLPYKENKDKKIASMGNWLSHKKQDLKKGVLDKDLKIAIETKLKDFGFKWNSKQDNGDPQMSTLINITDDDGVIEVQQDFNDDI